MPWDKLSDCEVTPSLGEGASGSPDGWETAGVLSQTLHICDSAGKRRLPQEGDSDANLSLCTAECVQDPPSWRCMCPRSRSSPEGILSRKKDVSHCRAQCFLDEKSGPAFHLPELHTYPQRRPKHFRWGHLGKASLHL